MHLLRYQVAVSIDGFIAPKDGNADWLNAYGKVAGEIVGPWMKQIGGLLLGRATFDQTGSFGGWMWGDLPTLLMTSRPLPKKPSPAIETFGGDPSEGLKGLRARMPKGDIWLFGGGVTAGKFLQAGLIDMIELTIVPVALGAGRTLFDGVAVQETFELASVQQQALGCVSNTYRRIETATKGAAPPKRRALPRSPRGSRSQGSR
jgi:dihydrofolate reductase